TPTTSTSTLVSQQSSTQAGQPALNARPSPAASIYQSSLRLIDRLICVPNFEPFLEAAQQSEGGNDNAALRDPTKLLWTVFRQGNSLCVLFNALRPSEPIPDSLDGEKSLANAQKKAVYLFVSACKTQHIVADEDLFTITDLYKDDTNSFVRVMKTVSLVLDEIDRRGYMLASNATRSKSIRFSEMAAVRAPVDNRDRLVAELLDTERKYVADLERLQSYMIELQQSHLVSNETVRFLFANLNSLVDFQRRFLIGVEANAHLPPDDQRFGALFVQMEDGFSVYEPYCANHKRASDLAVAERGNLAALSHVLDPNFELPSFLIKPVQRVCRYPLILSDLIKYCKDKDPSIVTDLEDGNSAIKRVVKRVNETRRKEENYHLVKDLEGRVDDWKGYTLKDLGELHLHEKFVMSTGDLEREMLIYLFDNILICCKESDKNANNNTQRRNTTTNRTGKGNRDNRDGKDNLPRLTLKGRIFLHSIRRIVNTSENGQFRLTLYWLDVMMENFSLKLRNEEQLNQWHSVLTDLIAEAQRKNYEHMQQQTQQAQPMRELNEAQLLQSQQLQMHMIGQQLAPIATSLANQYHPQFSPISGGGSIINATPTTAASGASSTMHSSHWGNSIASVASPSTLRVKVTFASDTFILMVPVDINYITLLDKVARKVSLCGLAQETDAEMQLRKGQLRMKYLDSEGHKVLLVSDDDTELAIE
ncbi:RhoGEF-domain-containing protein, partial [Ramicandelaber brevisporus]